MTTKISLNWKNALKLAMLLGLFWCLIVFLAYSGVVSTKIETDLTITDMCFEIAKQFFTNSTIFFALFYYQFSILKKRWKPKIKTFALTAGSLLIVFSIVALITFKHLLFNLKQHEIPNMFFVLAYAIIISAMTILLSSLGYIIGEREKAIVENEKLSVENMRARYETLKSQINPHFLFNSLNTLVGLISKDGAKAKEFVHQLSYVFRYSIQNKEVTTLDDELNCIEAYCNLMKIRYGESLVINYDIDRRRYCSYMIIPLSLQMLVENAIKHNTISRRHPLIITIETTDDNTVRVWNKMQPKIEDSSGEGIGLANMSERYNLLYHKEISISDTDGIFKVEIPLIKKPKKTKNEDCNN